MTQEAPQNLMSALLKERDRCKDLLQQYKEIGAPGRLGALLLEGLLQRADNAMALGDVVLMIQVYDEMRQSN